MHSSREDMGAGEKAQGKGLCVMEMCITAYSVMENAIHSTWKSKVQLSHVLQTALPTTQKCKPVIHSSTTPDGYGENRTPLSLIHKGIKP